MSSKKKSPSSSHAAVAKRTQTARSARRAARPLRWLVYPRVPAASARAECLRVDARDIQGWARPNLARKESPPGAASTYSFFAERVFSCRSWSRRNYDNLRCG
jgi:hypothetical protein